MGSSGMGVDANGKPIKRQPTTNNNNKKAGNNSNNQKKGNNVSTFSFNFTNIKFSRLYFDSLVLKN